MITLFNLLGHVDADLQVQSAPVLRDGAEVRGGENNEPSWSRQGGLSLLGQGKDFPHECGKSLVEGHNYIITLSLGLFKSTVVPLLAPLFGLLFA